jgi:Transcriptional regulator
MKKTERSAQQVTPYHHGDLRHALIDAAWNSIEEHGFETLSLAALAKALGVSQAAPYRHFSDRNALLAAVAVRGFNKFVEGMDNAARSKRKGSVLARMAQAYVDFGTRHGAIYRLMFASPLLNEVTEDTELKTAARRSFEFLLEALTDIPNPQQRKRKALHIWVALHGSVMLANQGLIAEGPVATSLQSLVDTIVEM